MSTFILRILTLLGILSTCQNFDLDNTVQLPSHIIPEHYTVELDLSTINGGFYHGTCYVRIRLDRPTESIHFHAKGQLIKKESLGLTKMYSLESCKPTHFVHNQTSDFVNIYFANELSEGQYIWQMEFITIQNKEGDNLFGTTYVEDEEERMIWLLGMNRGRDIFPCWDEPVFKAIFFISVLHFRKQTVLSNMPVQMSYGHDKRQTTMMWTHFHETPVITLNLLAILVSDSPLIFNKINERISLRCRQQVASYLGYAKMVIENVTLHFESQSKCYKELAKVDHVTIPDFPYFTLYKLGLILYSETTLICDEKLDLVTRKMHVARLVARAIAHQHVDNLVGHVFLSDALCLQWGILELYATNAVNKFYPELRIWDLFVVDVLQESLRLDSLKESTTKSLVLEPNRTEINSDFLSSCFIRAPVIFRMLKHVLGDDVFWNGTKIFLNFRGYNIFINYNNLWTAMQIALNNSNSVYKFNIKNMMNPWTKLQGYPVLKVKQHNSTHVKIYNIYPLNQKVQIPLTFTTQDESNFINTSPYLLTSLHRTIYLPLNLSSWIIINIQQTGYYRVNYDTMYWDRIIHYLRTSDEYTKIHVLNRAQLIDDAYYFLMHNQLPLSTFLKLTKYLERETDYIAWSPMITAFKYVPDGFFLQEKIKTHMRYILHKLFKNITYTDKPNEKPNDFIKCLREEAAKWACFFGDPNCKKSKKSHDKM